MLYGLWKVIRFYYWSVLSTVGYQNIYKGNLCNLVMFVGVKVIKREYMDLAETQRHVSFFQT